MGREGGLSIAYVHYGSQSGVTSHVADALARRGNTIWEVCAVGPLEPRDPETRRPRLSAQMALHLGIAALRFRDRALHHRWNTLYAFDVHSRNAGRLLRALARTPDAVLQNGALFAPGAPPPYPYVLLCDHTRALAMRSPPAPEVGLPAPVDYGEAWMRREAEVYRRARAIGTFSERVARSLERDYGVGRWRIHVVGAGANVFPERLERRDDGRTLLFVGKDFRRKGGPLLLEAFALLRRRHPSARLLIAGPTERLELPERAVNLGFVPLSELPALFAMSTAFVLPTLREPFGLAYLDAMACGLPCVGTAIEAVPEIIEDGRTGSLVPPSDPASLAEALGRLLSDPVAAREMGRAGREKVAARFRWEKVAKRLESVLRPPAEPEAVAAP